MSTITDATEALWMDNVVGNSTFGAPTTNNMILLTGNPGEGGSLASELPGTGGYARVATPNTSWGTPAVRAVSNGSIVDFGTITDEGVITHAGIAVGTILGAGTLYMYDAIPNIDTAGGAAVTFAIGELTLSVDPGGMTDYLSLAFLNHMLKHTSYAPLLTHYFGLSDGTPGDDEAGLNEPGAAYARIAKTNTAWGNAVQADPTTLTTAEDVAFGAPTGGDWTFASGRFWFIADALTGGNLLWYGATATNNTITDGTNFKLTNGGIVINAN